MVISGLQKLTLLDFPARVACTVFLGGCNFRCPFCQNGEILDGKTETVTQAEFFAFLEKRKKVLDGVCVSGGEPLLTDEIFPFVRAIKDMGYAVKIDTNGSFPERLEKLIDENLIDYVAMDVKNSPARYEQTAGVKIDFAKIEKSIALLLQGRVDYEFRTTIAAELHRPEDLIAIAKLLRGAKKYYLQNFVPSQFVLRPDLTPFSDSSLAALQQLLLPYLPSARLRGQA